MTPANWERIQQVFEDALNQPATKREQFVREACKGNAELESEILRLLEADAKPDGFLDRPCFEVSHPRDFDDNTPQLAPGEIISSRFKIVRLVGFGGMGQVYEAQDLDLGVRVALKTIRPEISSNPEVLARFKQEVRLTRRVTHPNVCRTFDLQRCARPPESGMGDITFLTMEFLDGETLRDFLTRRGALHPNEAFPIVSQMAQAISAAHDLGIVHRDVKPSNIILVPDLKAPRTVMTDFGLARFTVGQDNPENPLSSLTNTGRGIGTLAYMAPEQLEGAKVSTATDIYALGLVIYEMVTNSKAFPDDLPFGGIAHRLKHLPPSPRLLVPELSVQWEAAILHCLETNPADRFQHARDVVEAISSPSGLPPTLGNIASSSPKGIQNAWHFPLLQRAWPRRLALLATIGFALALFVWALRFNRMKSDQKVTPGSSILLTPVRNETGEKYFDGVTELMRNQLAQSAHFNLVEPNRIRGVLQQMTKNPDSDLESATAREVALRIGAGRVVFGAVSRIGDSYVLDVVIEQPDNQPDRARAQWDSHWSWREPTQFYEHDGTIPVGLLDAVRKSSEWIRTEVGEANYDIAANDTPPQDVTTDKWSALSEFSTAERFATSQKREEAVVALQNAVKTDPHFALAFMRMGDILVSLGRFEEGYQAYGTALGEERQRRLTRREKDRITGLRALDTDDFATAESAFRDYSVYYPGDYLGWFYRAYPLMKLSRVEEAIATLKKAEAIDPSRISAPAHIARCHLILGQFEEAGYWIRRLREAGHADDADDIQGELAYLQGNYNEAARFFGRLQESNDPLYRTWSYSLRARVAAEQGQFIQASQFLNDGLKADLSEGDSAHRADKLLDLAYIAFKLGHYHECLSDSKRALALDASPQRLILEGTLLGRAAGASAGKDRSDIIGQLQAIQARVPSSELKPISKIVLHRLRGEELLARGQWKAALAELRNASQLEAPASDREYLARALLILARHEPDQTTAANQQEEALAEYARAASRPGEIWQWPLDYFPGYLSDEILSFVQLSSALHKLDATAKAQLAGYLERHAQADKRLPDVEQAKQLFIRTESVNVH